MALIKCPECGTEVSDKAERCPKCSYPIAPDEKEEKTQVIEKTSKPLKQQMVYATVTFLGGFLLLICGYPTLGLIALVVGIVWIIATKTQIWWHHE